VLQGVRIGSTGEPLKSQNVDVEPGDVKGHCLFLDPQTGLSGREMGSQDEQSLAEIGPSLLVVQVRPEQRGELVARLRIVGVACEVGQ
jgi:hypothetical protein